MIVAPPRSNALAPPLRSKRAREDAEWIDRLIRQRTQDELVYAVRSTGCQGVPTFEFFEGTPCCSDADTCPPVRGELVLVARKYGMSSLVAPVSAAPLVSSGGLNSAIFSYTDPALTPHVPVLTRFFVDSKGNKFNGTTGAYVGPTTPATLPFYPDWRYTHGTIEGDTSTTLHGRIGAGSPFSYTLEHLNDIGVETNQNPCPDQAGTAVLCAEEEASAGQKLKVREYDSTPAGLTTLSGWTLGNYPTKFVSIVPDPLNGGWWALYKASGSRPVPAANATVTLGRTMHRYTYLLGVLAEVLPRITLQNAGTAWDSTTFVTVTYEMV